MSTPLHILVSPDAGRGRTASVVAAVTDELAAQSGRPLVDLTGESVAASQANLANSADEIDRLVIIGGDGMVHLALQSVAQSSISLGVVPVGTANDFAASALTNSDSRADLRGVVAQALGPASPIDAIEVVTDARQKPRWTASVATGGFSGVVNQRANQMRWPKGPQRYTVATAAELPRLALQPLTITVDGVTHHHETALYAVANTASFGGKMKICPDADATDGLLHATVVADIGRLELLRFFSRVFSGRHMSHPKVFGYVGREISIEIDDSAGSLLNCWGDGEPIDTGCRSARFIAATGAMNLAAG